MGFLTSGKSIGEWATKSLETSEDCELELELDSNVITNDYDVTTPVPSNSNLQFRFANEYPLLANVEYEIKFTLQPNDIVTFFYNNNSAVVFSNTDSTPKEYKYYPSTGFILSDPAFIYSNNGSNQNPFNLQIGLVNPLRLEIEDCDGDITIEQPKQTIEKTETTVGIPFPITIDGVNYTSVEQTFTYTSNVPTETPFTYPVSGKIKQVTILKDGGVDEIIEGCGCDAACGDTIEIKFTQFCGDVIDVKLDGWVQNGSYVMEGDPFSASNGNEIIPVLNKYAVYDLVIEQTTDSGWLYIHDLIAENEKITIGGIDYVFIKETIEVSYDSFSIYGQAILKIKRADTIKVVRRRCCSGDTPPEEEEE
jgi:hypothetical protein